LNKLHKKSLAKSKKSIKQNKAIKKKFGKAHTTKNLKKIKSQIKKQQKKETIKLLKLKESLAKTPKIDKKNLKLSFKKIAEHKKKLKAFK
jgi:hypothetical protein